MSNRNIFTGVNSIKFHNRFRDDKDCLEYISEIKWEGGYTCKRCNNDKYCSGKKLYNRRCTKCCYDESPTTGTNFEKLKFSIHIAFHIAFKISTKKKGMSSLELSSEFELRQKTCWAFKSKLQKAMASSLTPAMVGTIHLDTFFIGGSEIDNSRSGRQLKKLIVIAIEILNKGVGRVCAEVIEQPSSKELGAFLNKYVSNEAVISTGTGKGFPPLKKEFANLKQVAATEKNNFKELKLHIKNCKGWLNGIHHHCSKERLQDYLNEYHFRYNRRSEMDTIFDKLILKMINKP